MSATTNTSTTGGMMDKASNAASYVSETGKEMLSGEVAKGNTDASMTDRASAGMSAVGDKLKETGHSSKADAHKEAAKH